jgi:hypothetical protein
MLPISLDFPKAWGITGQFDRTDQVFFNPTNLVITTDSCQIDQM